jgi:hypothetical protein
MARLELLMTEPPKLTSAEARDLLSEHLDCRLSPALRAAVDACLDADPALALERRRLASTLTLLRGLPDPTAPPGLIDGVHRRVGAEGAWISAAHRSGDDDRRSSPTRRRLQVGAAVAAIACAALVVLRVSGGADSGGPGGMTAAGVVGEDAVEVVRVVSPGVTEPAIVALAAKAGMSPLPSGSPSRPDHDRAVALEGSLREASRFLALLKEDAIARGVDVSARLPARFASSSGAGADTAGRIRLEVVVP